MNQSKPLEFLSKNALKVLGKRYLKKNVEGKVIEKPEELFHRIAESVAWAEKDYVQSDETVEKYAAIFYDLLVSGSFLPNSPTLMNAGREMGLLSACFVLPIEDSIEGIFDTIKTTALIQKAGGGTGFSFDKLRPTGDYISTSGGHTSGPISFWKVLSEATNAIQQGAFRRGANMGMMSITHPDILKFIVAKRNLANFTNFNISVKITNTWMNNYLQNPTSPHVVINPRTKKHYVIPKDIDCENYLISGLVPAGTYNAQNEAKRPKVWTCQDLYDLIVECAWNMGEPGLVFIDYINDDNPTPHIGAIEATNPCGEQPLLPYEACNLGAINIAKFVESTSPGQAFVNWEKLRKTIHVAVRFLDNIIDINQYPTAEISAICKANRKIGLGIMGFADTLFLMDIPYNSDEGLAMGEKIMEFINNESHNASEALANERGCFPNWQGSIWDLEDQRKMRNAATTTVAPTGTISIIAGCSGGIEPLFSLAFYRNVLDGERLLEVNDIFKQSAQKNGFYSDDIFNRICQKGSAQDITEIPEEIRKVFVCSHDIPSSFHIKMQSVFQKHCDSSISKTINLPHDAKKEEVQEIYDLAWQLKCKGVTVYRDGCRKMQPMDLKRKANLSKAMKKPIKYTSLALNPVNTPVILSAIRIRQNTPFGHMHVTISVDPRTEKELEVFAQLGKAGDIAMSDLEAISRLTSLYLRIGGTLEQVINQLDGIGTHLSIPTKDGRVKSIADGLGKTLLRYLEAKKAFGLIPILTGKVDFDKIPIQKLNGCANTNGETEIPPAPNQGKQNMDIFKIKCPECNDGTLSFVEGCVKCQWCGYAQC